MQREHIETLLADVFVPVEPNPRFSKRLRARLVNYRGGRSFSGWTAIVVVASAALMAAGLVGMLVRFIAAGFQLLGLTGRPRQKAAG